MIYSVEIEIVTEFARVYIVCRSKGMWDILNNIYKCAYKYFRVFIILELKLCPELDYTT